MGGDDFLHDASAAVLSIVDGLVTTDGNHNMSDDDEVVFEAEEIADIILMASLLRRQFRIDVRTGSAKDRDSTANGSFLYRRCVYELPGVCSNRP